jgi:hypothetical protein
MKTILANTIHSASKIDRNTIQLAILLFSLFLFVIGAGAPEAHGGIGG